MTTSTRFLIIGLVLFGLGVALFYMGAPRGVTAASDDTAGTAKEWMGIVAGAMSGGGIALFALGAVKRFRRK